MGEELFDNTEKISQDEINNTVWKACDTFRGVVDPACGSGSLLIKVKKQMDSYLIELGFYT